MLEEIKKEFPKLKHKKLTDERKQLLESLFPFNMEAVDKELRTQDFPFVCFGVSGGNCSPRTNMQDIYNMDTRRWYIIETEYYKLIHLAVIDTFHQEDTQMIKDLGIYDYITAAAQLRLNVDDRGNIKDHVCL